MQKTALASLRDYLQQIPDDERKQLKFETILAIMEGEGGNFSAGIYVSVLASFAVALAGIGFDPQEALRNIHKEASRETIKLLAAEGITANKPKGTVPN